MEPLLCSPFLLFYLLLLSAFSLIFPMSIFCLLNSFILMIKGPTRDRRCNEGLQSWKNQPLSWWTRWTRWTRRTWWTRRTGWPHNRSTWSCHSSSPWWLRPKNERTQTSNGTRRHGRWTSGHDETTLGYLIVCTCFKTCLN